MNATQAASETTKSKPATIDANEAVAHVAYKMTEVFTIYPITPSTPMAEFMDDWGVQKKTNLFGHIPEVVEMQSEAGAAGAMHGSLMGGTLTSTFTASQGLLLMIPNMFKIAGELTPCVMHVTARTLATHALSIFGDHSDVMACRQTGWAMLAANSPQEAHDMAAIAHAATLKSRVPFLHFFDGFRTSHEINTVHRISDDILRSMIDPDALAAFRSRGLNPDAPAIRGTAQNPDVFFQARESCNKFYEAVPAIVQAEMDKFAAATGRKYGLVNYEGAPDAEHVIVIMGSGAETAAETAAWLNKKGKKTGVLSVNLYRPFPVDAFLKALPKTTKAIAVLDRTKEPGAFGEPLYLDIVAAVRHGEENGALTGPRIKITGGRYGLGSKEFTPPMVAAVYEEIAKDKPKQTFTIGINDDLTGLSLPYDNTLDIESLDETLTRAVFFGLGSDGTVGANKNSIKIIGVDAGKYAQGYFVYDSKKSGGFTVSHLRFGDRPIRAPYLIKNADFVGCHQFNLLDQQPVVDCASEGGILLINAPGDTETAWHRLSAETQREIIAKKLRVYAIDASAVARSAGLPANRTNTVMQVCFFKLSEVLPVDEAIDNIKKAAIKSYSKKGQEIVDQNLRAIDAALSALKEVKIPAAADSTALRQPPVPTDAPDFVRNVTGMILAGRGDDLPVSAFPVDGTWPSATAQYEKRNMAATVPEWDASICIQCNKCVQACPHAAIRAKFFDPALLSKAPEGFKSVPFKSTEYKGNNYVLQVAVEDCTGCELCVHVCPVKNKADPKKRAINMVEQYPIRERERANFKFFLDLPSIDRASFKADTPKNVQFLDPLFEFSGACAGCGETPYIKLVSQLFGDRAVIANATGCSSIYGGNLPTTPYTTNKDGRGPAWANSLFEDNAEFGLGMRLSMDRSADRAKRLLNALAAQVGQPLVDAILTADQSNDPAIAALRAKIAELKTALAGINDPQARELEKVADYLVKKSVWIFGGDGWAYDIGYGGLDHVIASGRNVNIMVLDTEVYSNTGGQCSKSTPLGATAKFAGGGKPTGKKDLALLATVYGNVYVARVAMGARDAQTLNAIREAESYDGPSLILAYAPCISHGFKAMYEGFDRQKLAVETGYWPLFRYDPRRAAEGKNPMQLDSAAPKGELSTFTRAENRYKLVARSVSPEQVAVFEAEAQKGVNDRFALYQRLADNGGDVKAAVAPTPAAPSAPAQK
ncbi:pyruvate-ferredoxin/flavodoxin oxidoreductase [Ereboglobus sp. PH5-5]|uniref:pyruvate:ferredoxin (flavodoxin) oxidoreductase n=1 Tax=Ereboglobus sp. PH5-5 TaxID=2940529 RepID=UPI0024072958|nr:pyruvate:ferredoxin (flavodoxin) oxidoreductase [Ereboglobus sp. PH5-5]MDF9833450.1 pyruvate-ferredoxin/flavodoxin oxidoreductase [Ereboglobus sp. PH5-5]